MAGSWRHRRNISLRLTGLFLALASPLLTLPNAAQAQIGSDR